MSINNPFYALLSSEYAKIKCPVCGKSPSLEISSYKEFSVNYCGHHEVEPLMEEADQRCVAKSGAEAPRTVRLVPPPKK